MSTNYSYIYDELLKLDINLSYDNIPSPQYIQEKIIQCNRYMAKVERFSIEISRALTTAERTFKIEKLNLEMLRRNTLTNNSAIQKAPTGKEREAAVDELLEDNHRELVKLENTVNDLKSIQSSIKLKYATLKLTNTDIRQLIKLMDQQINRLNIGHPDDPDIKELTQTYKEIDELEKQIEKERNSHICSSKPSTISVSQPDSDVVESVKPIDHAETDLQVAVEDADQSGESIVLGDMLESDPNNTVAQNADSQSTEDVGEISLSRTDVPVGDDTPELAISISSPDDAHQGTEDLENDLASFLTEDETIYIEPESDVDRDDMGELSSEDLLDGANFAANEESVEVPDTDMVDTKKVSESNDFDEDDVDNDDYPSSKEIDLDLTGIDLGETGIDLGDTGISDIETDIPENTLIEIEDFSGETGIILEPELSEDKTEISDVSSRQFDLPKMDIDLGDMGIDVEMSDTINVTSDIDTDDSPITNSTNENKTNSTKEKDIVPNKESEKSTIDKTDNDSDFDLDLEDIINSLD